MYTKHFFLTCLLVIICSNNANYLCAQQRTKQELDSIANSVFHHKKCKAASAPLEMKLKSSDVLQNDQLVNREAFYIYSPITGGEESFVIVSNDKRMPAVLGYSENSRFDFNDMPVGIKSFLEKISLEASYLIDTNSATTRTAEPNSPVVLPLLGERAWGQDKPFNSYCPKNNSTGCVATSLAQIMAMHKFPEYHDWKNMLDTYKKGKYTEKQADAVAKLMKDINDAIEATYHKDGSTSSNNFDAVNALINTFGYDDDCRILNKACYTDEEWFYILNNELLQGRPICYSGEGTGGHAFVVDGVDQNGLYHINWGWNGTYNGYFYLHNLAPDNEHNYSFENQIIVNIKPENGIKSENHTNVIGKRLISLNGHGLFQNDDKIETRVYDLTNYHPNGFKGMIKFLLTSDCDSLISVFGNKKRIPKEGLEFSGELPKNLLDGNYRIYIGVQQSGYENWEIVRMCETEGISARSYIELIVEDGYYTLGTGKSPKEEHLAKLVCEDLGALDSKIKGTHPRHYEIYPTFKKEQIIYNFGETSFSGIFQLLLYNEESGSIIPFGKETKVKDLIASEAVFNPEKRKFGHAIPDSVSNGKYRLYIGAKSENCNKWMFVENRNKEKPSYIDLVVKDSHINLNEDHYEEPEISFRSELNDTIEVFGNSVNPIDVYKGYLSVTNTSDHDEEFSYHVMIDNVESNSVCVFHSKKTVIPAGTTITDSIIFEKPDLCDYEIPYLLHINYLEDNSELYGNGKTVQHSVIFPNPSSIKSPSANITKWVNIDMRKDKNAIEITSNKDIKNWEIVTTMGQIVKAGTYIPRSTSVTIELQSLPHGVYLLRGIDMNRHTFTTKFKR